MGVLLHWTQASSSELVVRQSHGRPQGGQNRGESWRVEAITPPKTMEIAPPKAKAITLP